MRSLMGIQSGESYSIQYYQTHLDTAMKMLTYIHDYGEDFKQREEFREFYKEVYGKELED